MSSISHILKGRMKYPVVSPSNAHQVAGTLSDGTPVTYWDLIVKAHAGFMHACFPDCLEDLSLWQELLIEDPDAERYWMHFVLALCVHEEDDDDTCASMGDPHALPTDAHSTNEVTQPRLNNHITKLPVVDILGLCSMEWYKNSRTLWLGYIGVSEHARGRGVAKAMVRTAAKMLEEGWEHRQKPVQMTLSARKTTTSHDPVPAEVRHRLYESLGFLPVALDVYFCGVYQEASPSALAIYLANANQNIHDPLHDWAARGLYPPSLATCFLQDLYAGMLEVDDKVLTNELDPIIRQIEDRDYQAGIPLGSKYWTA